MNVFILDYVYLLWKDCPIFILINNVIYVLLLQ